MWPSVILSGQQAQDLAILENQSIMVWYFLPPFMNKSFVKMCAVFTSTLLLAACFGARERAMENAIEEQTGGEAEVDIDANGSMRIETEDGTVTTGGEMPDNWPKDVPTYPGAKVGFGASNTTDGGLGVIMTTSDSIEDVIAFYDAQMSGWTQQAVMTSPQMTLKGYTKGDVNVSLMVTAAEGMTSITLAIGE